MKRKINLEKVLAMMLILTQGVQLPPNGENHLLDQALAQAGIEHRWLCGLGLCTP